MAAPSPPVDEHFRNAGRKPGVEVWRIKEFKVVPVPADEYGTFFQGDSYIVLCTKGTRSEAFEWDVHYWLGKNTTQDEYGTAAIKTVELDQALGGGPVQYREVQGHESSLFLSYFKDGIRYIEGGHDSGFRKVADLKIRPRLFQCKGKRNVRIWEVPMKRESLNKGDVFILDQGEDIYVWIPPKAGRLERVRGIRHAGYIRDQERAGRGEVHVLDKTWDSSEGFWAPLGGVPMAGAPTVKTAVEGGEDEGYWLKEGAKNKLWKVSDSSGRLEISLVAEGDFTRNMLDSKDAFILDAGTGGVFVWVGKECTMDERRRAMSHAEQYLQREGRPAWTPIVRVLDTAEPAQFNQWFQKPVKNRPQRKYHLFEVTDESGELVVREVESFTQSDLDGDDVMILDIGIKVFIWIGKGATEHERKMSQVIAKRYMAADTLPRPRGAQLVVIHEGGEPDDFKHAFPSWDDQWASGQ